MARAASQRPRRCSLLLISSVIYVDTLRNIRDGRTDDEIKGKMALHDPGTCPSVATDWSKVFNWKQHDEGWHSQCVDASFLQSCSAWGVITDCASAETAESLACLEGIKDALLNV